jgi:hypothetical protein
MTEENQVNPSLFGLSNSNRDFLQKDSWGKNQFNSSFPASLACYMHSIQVQPVYIKLNSSLGTTHDKISVTELFGEVPLSDKLFFAFESNFVLDIFVWSDFAFTRLFFDLAKRAIKNAEVITRFTRSVVWLAKMLYDFANNGKVNHQLIIDNYTYNTKNDKAFAINGIGT